MDTVVPTVSARSTAILKRPLIKKGRRKASSSSSSSACYASSAPQTTASNTRAKRERKPRQKRKLPDTPEVATLGAGAKRQNIASYMPMEALPFPEGMLPESMVLCSEEEEEEEHGNVPIPQLPGGWEIFKGESRRKGKGRL